MNAVRFFYINNNIAIFLDVAVLLFFARWIKLCGINNLIISWDSLLGETT